MMISRTSSSVNLSQVQSTCVKYPIPPIKLHENAREIAVTGRGRGARGSREDYLYRAWQWLRCLVPDIEVVEECCQAAARQPGMRPALTTGR